MPTSQQTVTKDDADNPALKLAVLIDADNAQASVFEGLLAEIARFGDATVKRIYGDFTSNSSSQWKQILNRYSIKPVQQFAYTTGKNATDSSMIIDAMDLLYTRRFDGFCLVSSDSDFTGLAIRIREEGLMVYGFGEEKTPDAFRNACNKFVLTEVLRPIFPRARAAGQNKMPNRRMNKTAAPRIDEAVKPQPDLPVEFFERALDQAADDSGWANLGTFGRFLTKLRPDFDARRYGFKKLSDLVKSSSDVFITEERPIPNSQAKALYIRAKND